MRQSIEKISKSLLAGKKYELLSDEELITIKTGSFVFFDIECYENFFFIAFKFLDCDKYLTFEQSEYSQMNYKKLLWVIWHFHLVGFNSLNYDLPILTYALTGKSCSQLKKASDFIIKGNNRYFDFQHEFKVRLPKINHIDLIEVAPLQGSLKLYSGRIHAPLLQDLPFPEDTILSKDDINILKVYCCLGDLNNTELLFKKLMPEMKLRFEMSKRYQVNLLSKSDAQIAETVINKELEKALGYWPKKPKIELNYIKYNIPDFINFVSPQLKNVLEIIRNAEFEIDNYGSPIMPVELEKLTVKIGNSTYKLGMGGLHSQEKNVAYEATEELVIADNDVASFYPRIILNQRLYPEHLGESFLNVYENIVNTRIDAKKKAAKFKKEKKLEKTKHFKTIADSLKITINGSFGKMGNKYSTLYSPQLMLQVTITGQLSLLMLIEILEKSGIEVISGNTDGVVSIYHKSKHEYVRQLIAFWEKITNFQTEETLYSGIYSRDVNCYIAIKKDGEYPEAEYLDDKLGCKTKNDFCERGSTLNSVLSKNPECMICNDAVLHYLKYGTNIEKTIKECKDIRRFLSVRNVKGGGQKDGVYLGKVVRWYYAKNETSHISYCKPNKKGNFNKVPKTDGAKPLMELPEKFPDDINYDWYIKEAIEKLYDCGKLKKAKNLVLF